MKSLISAAAAGGPSCPVLGLSPRPGLAQSSAAPVLTPIQVAYLQAETRRIEEAFVQKVMLISGRAASRRFGRSPPRAA